MLCVAIARLLTFLMGYIRKKRENSDVCEKKWITLQLEIQ